MVGIGEEGGVPPSSHAPAGAAVRAGEIAGGGGRRAARCERRAPGRPRHRRRHRRGHLHRHRRHLHSRGRACQGVCRRGGAVGCHNCRRGRSRQQCPARGRRRRHDGHAAVAASGAVVVVAVTSATAIVGLAGGGGSRIAATDPPFRHGLSRSVGRHRWRQGHRHPRGDQGGGPCDGIAPRKGGGGLSATLRLALWRRVTCGCRRPRRGLHEEPRLRSSRSPRLVVARGGILVAALSLTQWAGVGRWGDDGAAGCDAPRGEPPEGVDAIATAPAAAAAQPPPALPRLPPPPSPPRPEAKGQVGRALESGGRSRPSRRRRRRRRAAAAGR